MATSCVITRESFSPFSMAFNNFPCTALSRSNKERGSCTGFCFREKKIGNSSSLFMCAVGHSLYYTFAFICFVGGISTHAKVHFRGTGSVSVAGALTHWATSPAQLWFLSNCCWPAWWCFLSFLIHLSFNRGCIWNVFKDFCIFWSYFSVYKYSDKLNGFTLNYLPNFLSYVPMW